MLCCTVDPRAFTATRLLQKTGDFVQQFKVSRILSSNVASFEIVQICSLSKV